MSDHPTPAGLYRAVVASMTMAVLMTRKTGQTLPESWEEFSDLFDAPTAERLMGIRTDGNYKKLANDLASSIAQRTNHDVQEVIVCVPKTFELMRQDMIDAQWSVAIITEQLKMIMFGESL